MSISKFSWRNEMHHPGKEIEIRKCRQCETTNYYLIHASLAEKNMLSFLSCLLVWIFCLKVRSRILVPWQSLTGTRKLRYVGLFRYIDEIKKLLGTKKHSTNERLFAGTSAIVLRAAVCILFVFWNVSAGSQFLLIIQTDMTKRIWFQKTIVYCICNQLELLRIIIRKKAEKKSYTQLSSLNRANQFVC